MYDLQELLHTARRTGESPAGLLGWARDEDDEATLAAAHVISGICAGLNFDLDAAFHHCDEAIALYAALPFHDLDEDGIALHRQFLWSAHTTRGIYLDDLGRLTESVAEHRFALELARETGYERGQVVGMSNLCEELLRSGDATEATFHLLQPGVDHDSPLRHSLRRIRSESMALLYHASGLEAESLVHMRDILNYDGATEEHDSLTLMAQLAFVEASQGRVDECQQVLDLIETGSMATSYHRIQAGVALARARLLAGEGAIDQALAMIDRVDGSTVANKEFEDLAHPLVARIEILAVGGRAEEALALADSWPHPVSQISLSQVYRLRVRLLADLGRWEEALVAARLAEEHRQQFDLDVARYIDLSFPSGNGSERRPPVGPSDPARAAKFRRILAHDIRGLFTPVQLAFDASQFETDAHEYRKKLELVVSLLDRMRDAPENMVSYLTLVEGAANTELVAVPVAETVDDVLQRFAPVATRKGISTRRAASPEVSVRADRNMLTASLNNLVSNAIKFTPSLRSITVGWRRVAGAAGVGPDVVEIEVADQGPGLTAEEREQIFRRTRTWAARPTAGESSTGLGLEIVAGFVNAMQGEVRAEASEDGGARFVLSFPVAGDDQAAAPPGDDATPSAADHPGTGYRQHRRVGPLDVGDTAGTSDREEGGLPRFEVLVFDDDPLVLVTVTEMLERVGAHVRATSDYTEAYTLLTGPVAFQLCIFDVMINGVPLGKQLSTLAATLFPNTTIVVMTGTDIVFDDDELRYARFVRKPVGFPQIAELVSTQVQAFQKLVADTQRDEPSPRTTEAGRIRLLFEIVQGRELPDGWGILVDDDPNDAAQAIDALTLVCVYETKQQRPETAIEHGLRALALLDETKVERPIELTWQLHESIGVAHFESDRHDEALSWHRQALTLAERAGYEYGECRSAIRLAAVHTSLGQSEAAIGVLASAIDKIGSDPSSRALVFAQLGQQLLAQGATELAVAQLRRALDNYSPLEVDHTRRTLQLLALGYLDGGDLTSLEVILARLHRLSDTIVPSVTDRGFDDTMRGAIHLARGEWSQALHLARQAFESAIGHSHIHTLWAPVAFATMVDALNKLDRHAEVVENWRDPNEIPRQFRGQQAFLNIASSCEAVGDFKAAVANQLETYRLRSHRNLGLPTLVALSQTLLDQVEAAIRESETTAGSDEGASPELRRSFDEIIEQIDALRQSTIDAINEPDGRTGVQRDAIATRLRDLQDAVVRIDSWVPA